MARKKKSPAGGKEEKTSSGKPAKNGGTKNVKSPKVMSKAQVRSASPRDAMTSSAAIATTTANVKRISLEISMLAGLVQVEASDDAGNRYASDFPASSSKPFLAKVCPKILAAFFGQPVVLKVVGREIAADQ